MNESDSPPLADAPYGADAKLAAERQLLIDASARGGGAKLRAYAKLSGPGWLQSAITLGGGSLSGACSSVSSVATPCCGSSWWRS